MQILLSNSQAGPGRTVKQEQKEISRNHVQAFSGSPVVVSPFSQETRLGKRVRCRMTREGERGAEATSRMLPLLPRKCPPPRAQPLFLSDDNDDGMDMSIRAAYVA